MTPRLKSSKKWTAFPRELSSQIENIFEENFKDFLGGAKVLVEGRIYKQEIALRVGFLEKERLKQSNFESSTEYSSEKDNAVEKIHLSVDFIASLMTEFFESPENEDGVKEMDLPFLWKAISFENATLYFQFTTTNTKLEAEADRLLGQSSETLLQDEEEELDLDEIPNEDQETEEVDPDPKKRTIH